MGKSKDSIELAKDFFNEFLSRADPDSEPLPDEKRKKAKAAGRKGGLKGGPGRAASLSDSKRKQAAKKAAQARWKPKPISGQSNSKDVHWRD
jgi:hypothetical protein